MMVNNISLNSSQVISCNQLLETSARVLQGFDILTISSRRQKQTAYRKKKCKIIESMCAFISKQTADSNLHYAFIHRL